MTAVMPTSSSRQAPKMNMKTGSIESVVDIIRAGFTVVPQPCQAGRVLTVEYIEKSQTDENCQGQQGHEQQPAQQPSFVIHMHEERNHQPRFEAGDCQRAPDMADSQVEMGHPYSQGGQSQQCQPDSGQLSVTYDVVLFVHGRDLYITE